MDMSHAPSTSTRGHIVIEDVVKVYDADGAAVLAVDHCSLEIEPGEICMIVGPSGCGKTTLLNAIAGFHAITSGRIVMDGEVLCSTEMPKSNPGPDRIVVFQKGPTLGIFARGNDDQLFGFALRPLALGITGAFRLRRPRHLRPMCT